MLEVNLPHNLYLFQTATSLYYLKKPIETSHKSLLYTSGGKETHKVNINENLWRFGDGHIYLVQSQGDLLYRLDHNHNNLGFFSSILTIKFQKAH